VADIFGHIGYLFIAVGLILLAQKSIFGWIFRIIGEMIWAVVGICIGMSALWFWGIIFLCLDVRGFIKWRKRGSDA